MRSLGAVLAITVAVVTTGVLVVVTDGNPAFALAPVAAALALLGTFRLPLASLAGLLVFVSLVVDNPSERPGMGAFKSIVYAPGKLFYIALDASAGIPGLKLFGIELLFGLLTLLVLIRARNRPKHEPAPLRPASPLTTASMWAVAALLLLEVYGIATGGNARFSMLQLRALLFAVWLPFVLSHCFDQDRHADLVVKVILGAACVRAALGVYYWATLMRHGVVGEGDLGGGTYVMTHSDSVLAAVAVLYCFVRLYEQPSVRALLISGAVVPPIMFFMIVNNRRLAFVGLVLGVAAIYFAADRVLRRRVHLTVLACLPLLIGYVAAGWTSNATWARPVQTLRSVVVQEDASSATRGIENYNLILTLKQRPLLGWGLGHEYVEQVHANDISKFFEAYRYVPHNSILWLWTVGAVPGAFAVFALLAVGVFLAVRTHRCSSSPQARVLALLCVGGVIVYGVQAFGDMGLQSWMGALVLGTLLGFVGHASVRATAWPGACERREDTARER